MYPSAKGGPCCLLGKNSSADAAIILGNRYPDKFCGIVFSGGSEGLDIKNLDDMPIAYFHSEDAEVKNLWSGPHFIQKLHDRGNKNAFVSSMSVSRTIHKISKLRKDTPKQKIHRGFLSFWSNEPLYIVYQDIGKNEYTKLAFFLAENLSKLNLRGLPKVTANLPVLPLSDYNPEDLPEHRAIIIGQHNNISGLLKGNSPVEWYKDEIVINKKIINFKAEDCIYALNHPPKGESNLKLAMLLSAENETGLQALTEHYTKAISIFDCSDMKIWNHEDDNYELIIDQNFDEFWIPLPSSSFIAEVRQEPHFVWEKYLQQMLIENSGCKKLLIGDLTDQNVRPMTYLNEENIEKLIPEKNFAIMKLKEKSFVVETDDLVSLPDSEYRIMPYSLREMVLHQTKNKNEFLKKFAEAIN